MWPGFYLTEEEIPTYMHECMIFMAVYFDGHLKLHNNYDYYAHVGSSYTVHCSLTNDDITFLIL